jgi:hypothetical protein
VSAADLPAVLVLREVVSAVDLPVVQVLRQGCVCC